MSRANYVESKKTTTNLNKAAPAARDPDWNFVEHHQRASWLDSRTLLTRAAGKINLTLSVGARRPDGYHMFESLMATVTLYDDLLLKLSKKGLNLTCDDGAIPTGVDNLVYRASTLLAEQSDLEPNIDIELIKRIPTQAGLGGGSADAAATLLGLNELWNLGWPNDELVKLAAMLGSDVGFFLEGPLAICSGRGEQVRPLEFVWDFWAVIVKPKVSLSTAEVYKHFVPKENRPFLRAGRLAKLLPGSKPSQIYPYLENDLESAAFRVRGELGELRNQLEKSINVPVRLSGSGSAMFALFDTRDLAGQAMQRIQSFSTELNCWLVKNNTW